jgi:acetoacetyl-[acyl-carrier protein] synthase
MTALPVIVGFGGINPAGRSSAHHGYRRLVLDNLSQNDARDTKASLASLMGLLQWDNGQWLNQAKTPVDLDSYLNEIEPILKAGTLIRKLENDRFDPDHIPFHKKARLTGSDGESIRFRIRRNQLPDQIPMGWLISDADDGQVDVEVHNGLDVLTESVRPSPVNAAGQLPSGFDPKALYQSRNHPRGLQMTVFGASDAIQSLGFDWEQVLNHVSVEQISVYAGSSMSQLDYEGNGGLMQARLLGNRVSSKQLALGFAEMPADFINAYVLGNLGTTGTNAAACATFLYNLRQAIRDISSGTHRIAVVGTAEAPILPEVIDGYATMGALVNDKALLALDEHLGLTEPDFRRSCRPFGVNAGFTLGESAQFIVLCDDKLALELGANIHGAVNDVFVNADGFKKSISSPGVGNYLTMAQAVAATANVIGEQGLRERSYIQAHGTGTPQNRVTESHIFSTMAKNWGIEKWPITALKTYIGHSLASSSADQLVASLGLWRYGWMPGITTIDKLADDVHQTGLDFVLNHREVGRESMDAVILNAKGFGGNNASASILAPHVTRRMLEKRHGQAALAAWQQKNEAVAQASREYDSAATRGETSPIYRFGDQVIDGMEEGAVSMTADSISIQGYSRKVTLPQNTAYADMLDSKE